MDIYPEGCELVLMPIVPAWTLELGREKYWEHQVCWCWADWWSNEINYNRKTTQQHAHCSLGFFNFDFEYAIFGEGTFYILEPSPCRKSLFTSTFTLNLSSQIGCLTSCNYGHVTLPTSARMCYWSSIDVKIEERYCSPMITKFHQQRENMSGNGER